MTRFVFAVASAAALFATTPLPVETTSARAQEFQVAQGIDVQIGRDRDDYRRDRRDRDGVTLGVGPGGVVVGPNRRERCRTVTTTIRRDDGRRIKKTERICS
jgi:hypothetical protein